MSVRMPAEWEPVKRVMIAWPHADTDWAPMLDEVCLTYSAMAHAIANYVPLLVIGPDLTDARNRLADLPDDRVEFVEVPTNDTWTRDYGPIVTVGSSRGTLLNDFRFNGWGLKFAADRDNRVNRRLADMKVWQRCLYRCRQDLVLEGGSIESDGKDTILTTSQCLLSPNRNPWLSRRQIERRLHTLLGAERVLWLDHGYLAGDDTDSHVDTLARLAPNDTILYTGAHEDTSDEHHAELTEMARQLRELRTADGRPYNLIELPLPDPIYDEDGQRLPATYANFLIIGGRAIIMPTYAQPRRDMLASQIMKVVFPGYDIVGVDCRALIKQHGSLHCATMQLMI